MCEQFQVCCGGKILRLSTRDLTINWSTCSINDVAIYSMHDVIWMSKFFEATAGHSLNKRNTGDQVTAWVWDFFCTQKFRYIFLTSRPTAFSQVPSGIVINKYCRRDYVNFNQYQLTSNTRWSDQLMKPY